ncbi:RNA 2',3'-cyclic phosphodiesterase [Methylacidimicrobium tartarophylax]|uniref:RNA 2',3'-cyclic phosphodiesterase n=1 Tax=Methylacidimicrobium tartarophylax TaxID=1041768 RepID=A0A5E6MFB0_9BACT|nr:RNA 2',3'-cyclic phosphodiesterase [Methylacidimicrobium tartarophylax]VVM07057.1 RNA 2',3'-cyclic phosphodiesterase [Methylacidimicrobium tartarophylax]
MRLRLFFALWPSREEQLLFRKIADDPGLGFSARWLVPEKIHLTLAFLPSVEEERVGSLCALVERLRLPMIPLRLDRLLLQPAGREGLLWLAPNAPSPSLVQLVRSLQEGCVALDLSSGEWRRFSPHITLARHVIPPCPPDTRRKHPVVLRCLAQPIDWLVPEMALVSSEALPEGSRYTRLASWALPTTA